MYVDMYECMYVCMYICMYVCMYDFVTVMKVSVTTKQHLSCTELPLVILYQFAKRHRKYISVDQYRPDASKICSAEKIQRV